MSVTRRGAGVAAKAGEKDAATILVVNSCLVIQH